MLIRLSVHLKPRCCLLAGAVVIWLCGAGVAVQDPHVIAATSGATIAIVAAAYARSGDK